MTQDKDIRLDSFKGLLDDFKKFSGHRVERPRTFMEIAGYPHYENACSNILAFFMDPEESHGLGTLVLDALASATDFADGDGVGSNVSVEREVGTEAGNRIDLLIKSDTRAILIENKIYAGASNPFDDYASYLNKIAGARDQLKILLTLYPGNEGSQWGFTNLLHEEFVGQIRSLLGHYVSSADARHLTMFLDFLNTLENLRRGTRMDKEFVEFLAKRNKEIEVLHTDLESFRRELNDKVQSLKTLIQAKSVYPGIFGEGAGPKATLASHLHHIIDITEDFQAHISTIISPHGWEIEFFVLKKGEYPRLRELLRILNIPFEEKGRERFIHPTHFAYDENLEEIRPVVQELIDKLATSQERAE